MAALTTTNTASLRSPLRSPLSTPSRRVVLGDKTTNSPVHKTLNLNASSGNIFDIDGIKVRSAAQVTLEQTEFEMARVKRTPLPTNFVAGQKRGIEQVEHGAHAEKKLTEEAGETKNRDLAVGTDDQFVATPQSLESSNEKKDDVEHQSDTVLNSPQEVQATRQGLTTMPSFHASQEGPIPLEEQFNIQEELSQNTVARLNATPLPPYGVQFGTESFNSNQSQGSGGMSSLVDFDLQEEGGKAEIATSPMSHKRFEELDKDERKKKVQETAERLKVVLGFAAYKVKTGQVNKTIEELTTPRSTRSPSLPPVSDEAEEAAEPGKGVMSSASKAANGLLDLGRSRH